MLADRRLRVWAGWWVASFGFWLLLDDTVAVPELVDGAVVAAVAATLAAAVIPGGGPEHGLPVGILTRLGRPLWRMLGDLPMLTGVLIRAVTRGERRPGAIGRVPFRAPDPAGADAARVALATYAGSLAPGAIVLGCDGRTGELVTHGLTGPPSPDAADPLELG